jgi:4-amino-4-deoxy-L-arabinose transferase-like glycosyltransferase
VLRLANILTLPVFTDESTWVRSGQFAALGPPHLFLELHYGAPPLFSWLEAPLMRLYPWTPILDGRIVAALVGTCTCILVMACARQLGHGRLIPLAGWAYTLCPYAVFNNRMAMLDGTVAACTALTLFFTLRLSRRPDKQDKPLNLLSLGLAIGAGLLTKFFAAALLLLPMLLAITARNRVVRLRLIVLPTMIGLTMLIPVLFSPGGQVLVAQIHQHSSLQHPAIAVARQFGALGAWAVIYLTIPGCLLGLIGMMRAVKDGRSWHIVAVWPVLSALVFTSIPATFYASRYVFFLVVPAVLLIALGADHVLRHVRPRRAAALLALALVPALAQDGLLVAAPAHALLVPFDRWQYVEGWPAGYGFPETVAWLKRAARRGPVVVACSFANPPGDALHEELGGNPNVTIMLLDLGNAQAGIAFTRVHPGAFIVTDEQAGSPALSAALRARVREVARFWKPGHRAAYAIYQAPHPTT